MYRFLNSERNGSSKGADARDEKVYDEFKGQVIIVDLATIDGFTEKFDGRAWLQGRIRCNQHFAWDVQWQPDRQQDSDNPVALMTFADESTVLMMRTHRTKNWLPQLIAEVLRNDAARKVRCGWDAATMEKMNNSFHFTPTGVVDLVELAKQKGLGEQSLKSLAEHFGLSIRRDTKVARTNWGNDLLSQEQIRYAADEAYFMFLMYDKLQELEDPPISATAGFDALDQGALMLRPGWENQGITRRHDGLYCTKCDKGPMTVGDVVERHIESKGHKKKIEERLAFLSQIAGGVPDAERVEMPDEWVMQGIIAGDGLNDVKVGEYKCKYCDNSTLTHANVEAHIKSKKHLKHTAPPPEAPPPVEETAPAAKESKKLTLEQQEELRAQQQEMSAQLSRKAQEEMLQKYKWNLPDYVAIEEESAKQVTFTCKICSISAQKADMIMNHLGGTKHNKKCSLQGLSELIHNADKDRLEDLLSGKPVVRSGHKAPSRRSREARAAAASAAAADTTASPVSTSTTAGPAHAQAVSSTAPANEAAAVGSEASNFRSLPAGWREHKDEESGRPFYHNELDNVVQWQHPLDGDCKPEPARMPDEEAKSSSQSAPEETTCAACGNAEEEKVKVQPHEVVQEAHDTSLAAVLPPGWCYVAHDDGDRYYVDTATAATSWDPPAVYKHLDWHREVHEDGEAFWYCSNQAPEGDQIEPFWEREELNQGAWKRYQNAMGKVYWINQALDIRFYEEFSTQNVN